MHSDRPDPEATVSTLLREGRRQEVFEMGVARAGGRAGGAAGSP